MMKKLALLISLVALVATTGAFAQTTPSADDCSVTGTGPDNTLGGANSTAPSYNSGTGANTFNITIPGPTTGTALTFSSVAAQTDNDQGVTGLVVREYFGGDEISCFGRTDGVIAVYVAGGTGPYDYQLFSGTSLPGTLVDTENDVAAQNFEFNGTTGGSSAGLIPAGQYFAVVTDANGCAINTLTAPTFTGGTVPAGYTVGPITLEQPDQLAVTYCQSPDLCLASGGEITLSLSGGTQPYNLSWAPGTFQGATGTGGVTPTAQAGTVTAASGSSVSTGSSPSLVGTTPATAQNVADPTAAGSDYAAETENTQSTPQVVTISGLTGSYQYNLGVVDANGCPLQ